MLFVCRALLESDRAITQTNERTLIKQLGMWLGLLTFAKNKPVLAKDMDLKALIQDAYTRGRMIAVLPFVEKVLAGCKDTKVCVRAGCLLQPQAASLCRCLRLMHKMGKGVNCQRGCWSPACQQTTGSRGECMWCVTCSAHLMLCCAAGVPAHQPHDCRHPVPHGRDPRHAAPQAQHLIRHRDDLQDL
jgi:hypothetical protein